VPACALARGVQPPGALPPAELALGLLAGETAKTLATLAMLRAELGAAPGGVERHAPWANRRYDPTRDWWDGEEEERSDDAAAEAAAAEAAEAEAEASTPTPLSLPPRVASVGIGVGFGALASVLARLADAVALGRNPAVDAAQSPIASDESQIDTALTSLLDPSLGVLPPACLAVTSLALAPGLEELIFRGFALPAVERRVANRYVSTAIVAAAFAAAHLGSSGAEKIQLFLAACCFGGAFWTTRGGLVAPTAAHAAFNLGVLLETRATYR
jgi:membrane protease YdiL (CAAX protease family)